MAIKLNRNNIFLIGLFIIFIYLVLNRVDYIIGSNTTEGEVIKTRNHESIIKFQTDSKEITFHGTTIMTLEIGEKVRVIYKVENPKNAKIYRFSGFWFIPILYCLLPLMVLTAAAFSFLAPSNIIIISYEKRKLNVTKTTVPHYGKEDNNN